MRRWMTARGWKRGCMRAGMRAGMRVGMTGAALILWASLALADGLAGHLRPGHPDSYLVVKGDTLWDISGRFLVQPWLWPELWRNNPQIVNPHLIYPGDRIYILWVDGQPRFELERGPGGRSYRLTPGDTVRLEPTIRSTPIESAIPAIRLDVIEPFLVQNRIIEPGALEAAPYVLQGEGERLVSGAGDPVYVRGDLRTAAPTGSSFGERFSIVRQGPVYQDPETGEILGQEATFLGMGDALSQENSVATLRLAQVREEVRQGDRVLPTEARDLAAMFYPRPPAVPVQGQILAVPGGMSQIGPLDVVVLNRGEREGLAPGDTLAVWRRGAVVRDPIAREDVQLPGERAGVLMVFRAFDKLSYGIVLQAERALAVGDELRNP